MDKDWIYTDGTWVRISTITAFDEDMLWTTGGQHFTLTPTAHRKLVTLASN
jgi:hypothetical protein